MNSISNFMPQTEYQLRDVGTRNTKKKRKRARRKRATWACDECRRVHLACKMSEGKVSGKDNCKGCEKRAISCKWTPQTNKRGKKARNKGIVSRTTSQMMRISQIEKVNSHEVNLRNHCGFCLILEAATEVDQEDTT